MLLCIALRPPQINTCSTVWYIDLQCEKLLHRKEHWDNFCNSYGYTADITQFSNNAHVNEFHAHIQYMLQMHKINFIFW